MYLRVALRGKKMKIRPDSKKEKMWLERIEHLLGTPCHIVDLYPELIPADAGGSYFEINDWILMHEYRRLAGKSFRILLKLNCYYGFTILSDDHVKKDPKPEDLRKCVYNCYSRKTDGRKRINIFLNDARAMLILDGDDTYLQVYNADERLQRILEKLAATEGMFFRESPAD